MFTEGLFGPSPRRSSSRAGSLRSPGRTAIFIAFVLLPGAAPATTHYDNDRFGFGIDIPAGFVADRPPDNDDGRVFHSPDGAMEVRASAMGNAMEDTLAAYVDPYVQACRRNPPEYFDLHPQWAVLSCTTDAGISYVKVVMRGRGEEAVFTTVEITYPAEARQRWDAVAVATAKSLRPAVPQ